MVALLTPIAKAFLADMGLDVTVLGQQVFGGHGYIREWGQEQLVRDVRIAQIYEGTNGIQAHDLLGRKVTFNRGENVRLVAQEIETFVAGVKSEELASFCQTLMVGVTGLVALTDELVARIDESPNELGAAAMEYLHYFGYIMYGYMWLKMAVVAEQKIIGDDGFYQSKLDTMKFYFDRVFPRTSGLYEAIRAGFDSMDVNVDWL